MVTEFDFILPRGLVDAQGIVHREGVMRLATARDEILIVKDSRARESEAYGELILLSRVITRLGEITEVVPDLLENLFTLDLSYLREFYNRINQQGTAKIAVDCPVCNNQFLAELALSGEL
ncbi:MAG: phage tail assembly protein [Acaryochloris sp. RU_4_1]|nr:phage tail assembly protein [Acaryochloris sp. RU_4_1]NJR54604.1 phage tail assembly protein [Acaryochloris sp. CRU_2_0]